MHGKEPASASLGGVAGSGAVKQLEPHATDGVQAVPKSRRRRSLRASTFPPGRVSWRWDASPVTPSPPLPSPPLPSHASSFDVLTAGYQPAAAAH
jgi:hypothetical protein